MLGIQSRLVKAFCLVFCRALPVVSKHKLSMSLYNLLLCCSRYLVTSTIILIWQTLASPVYNSKSKLKKEKVPVVTVTIAGKSGICKKTRCGF